MLIGGDPDPLEAPFIGTKPGKASTRFIWDIHMHIGSQSRNDQADVPASRPRGPQAWQRAEHEAAEEAKVHAARQLHHRHEGLDRIQPTEEAGQAEAAVAADHGERADHRAIADQFQHCIDALRVPVAHALRQVRRFQHHFLRAQRLERLGALRVARRGDDAGAGMAGDIYRRLIQCRCGAADDDGLAGLEVQVAKGQPRRWT